MKTLTYYILYLLLNTSFCFGQITEWEIIDEITYPKKLAYKAIDCVNDRDCIAVGNMQDAWPWNRVTTDGGKTWFTTLMDSTEKTVYINVRDVAYPDTSLCIILADSNYVWRSTDKCKTWEKSNLFTTCYDNSLIYYNISMANKYFGVINLPGEALLTSNGGASWNKIKFNLPDSLLPKTFIKVNVLNDCTIIFLVYNNLDQYNLIISKDYGITWEASSLSNGKPTSIYFIDRNEGWATCKKPKKNGSPINRDIILHTTDGGQNWEIQLDSLPEDKFGLAQIHFADKLYGVANGFYFHTWITSDGGKHWELDQASKLFSDFFMYVFMLSGHEILAVSYEGYIFKSRGNSNKVYENNIINIGGLSLSPNPANDFIEITLPNVIQSEAKNPVIKIYNVFGQEVNLTPTLSMLGEGGSTPFNSPAGGGHLRIDVSMLPAGLYFVRVGGKVGKFVKI